MQEARVPFSMPASNPLNRVLEEPQVSQPSFQAQSGLSFMRENAPPPQVQSNALLGMDIIANKSKMVQDTETHAEESFQQTDDRREQTSSNFQQDNEAGNYEVDDDDDDDDDDNFSMGPNDDNQVFDESSEDVVTEKRKLLFKIYCMERKGISLAKKFTMMDSLAELKGECDRVSHEHNVKSSVRFSRKMLMMSVTAIEYLNTKFDPFDVNLDGWSESVHENQTDYDDVFAELYEKYHTKTAIAPEIKLMLMLGGSGFMFHLTNTMFKQNNLPPSVMSQFAGVNNVKSQQVRAQNAMGGGGFGGGLGGGGMGPPVGVDDILSELKNSRDLDSMSDDSQSVVSTASTENKFIKIQKGKKRGKRKGNFVHLDL